MATLEEKRKIIKQSEERMDYHLRMQTERPDIARIYEYWWHWYRMRRIYWLTSVWLEELRSWKKEVKSWEEPAKQPDMKRVGVIRKNVDTIEDGIVVVEREERDTEQIARSRNWHIRFPRPHKTMTSWIRAKRRRLTRIRYWIKEIRRELPALWKNFVYVIYYAYTAPGGERHLEAHLEGLCYIDPKVQEKVKMLANKLLRQWVAKPITTGTGLQKPGYAVPLLISDMAKPPYEGRRTVGSTHWEWGVQWMHVVDEEGTVKPAKPETITKEKVTLKCEIFDYDYMTLRMFNTYDVPPVWWEESQTELEKMLKVGVYMLRRFVEREKEKK